MNTWYPVSLTPVDPLLFTDNRSARAGQDHLIRDQDPFPAVIYGAIGANIAAKLGGKPDPSAWSSVEPVLGKFVPDLEQGDENRAELCGYYYCDPAGKPWFPRPQHLILNKVDDGIYPQRSRISELGSTERVGPLDLKHLPRPDYDAPLKEVDRLVSQDLLTAALCDNGLEDFDMRRHLCETDELFLSETRAGLVINEETYHAQDRMFFSRPYRRFRSRVSATSGVWNSVTIQALFKTVKPLSQKQLDRRKQPLTFLGGDRGRAFIEFGESINRLDWLKDICEAVKNVVTGSRGFCCYLLTPAVLESGWPQVMGLNPITLNPQAAAVGKATTRSGWNAEPGNQGPRPIQVVIPAGSVFFYLWPDKYSIIERQQLIDRLWLQPITENSGGRFRNAGYGRILTGVWR